MSALFEAMSRAAMLNPDPPEPGEDEGDDELIFDQDGLAATDCTEEQVCVRKGFIVGRYRFRRDGKGFE